MFEKKSDEQIARDRRNWVKWREEEKAMLARIRRNRAWEAEEEAERSRKPSLRSGFLMLGLFGVILLLISFVLSSHSN